MLLTTEGLEMLLARVAEAVAHDPEAHALLSLNNRATNPDRVRRAIAACEIEMTPDDITLSAPRDAQGFLYPLGGVIADAIDAELGARCGFIMQ